MLICLHLGAHKTASTYMQSKLAEEREKLSQFKIGFVSHNFFRREIADRLDTASGFGGVGYAAVKSTVSGTINRLVRKNRGQDRLIMSDENIAGSLLSALGEDGLYPDIRRRLSVVLSGVPASDEVKVFFCVRGYAEYYSSIYAYRSGQRKTQDLDLFRKRAFELKRGWREVVADICEAAGPERTFVWSYETFAATPNKINHAMIGDWKPKVFVKSDKASLPSLTRKGLAVLDRASDILSTKEYVALSRVVARFEFDRPDEKFSLFDPMETERLSRRYDEDIAAISAMGCGVLFPDTPYESPPQPEKAATPLPATPGGSTEGAAVASSRD